MQLTMVAGLALVYGVPAEVVRVALAPLVAEVAGVMTASSLSKLLPGWGGLVQAAVALALTEAVGQLADRCLCSCCEARMRGEPAPAFALPLAELAEFLKRAKLGRPKP